MAEPKLRFKKDDGNEYPDWTEVKLSEIATRVTRKNKDKTRNPNQVSNVKWEDFSFETLCEQLGSAQDIPETEVEMEGSNDGGKTWKKYKEAMSGTSALQAYYKTPYTYQQLKIYVEKNGYTLKSMVVENSYESRVVKNETNEVTNSTPVNSEAKGGRLSLDDAYANPNKPSREYVYMNEETSNLLSEIVKSYPWGLRAKVESALLEKIVKEYAKENGFC